MKWLANSAPFLAIITCILSLFYFGHPSLIVASLALITASGYVAEIYYEYEAIFPGAHELCICCWVFVAVVNLLFIYN